MVRERVFLMPAQQVEIVLARLGNDAGLIGAALWAATGVTSAAPSARD
jgi:hypothetical protein